MYTHDVPQARLNFSQLEKTSLPGVAELERVEVLLAGEGELTENIPKLLLCSIFLIFMNVSFMLSWLKYQS